MIFSYFFLSTSIYFLVIFTHYDSDPDIIFSLAFKEMNCNFFYNNLFYPNTENDNWFTRYKEL